MKVKVAGFLLIGFLTVSGAAFAHHGTASFDTSQQITKKGTVTGFKFENPHVLVFLTLKDENGNTEEWQGELTSPNRLARAGWTRSTLKPGEEVTLIGYPSKTGAHTIWIQKVLSPAGTEIKLEPGEN